MPPTGTPRIALPDDPEEIRALFTRRMRERDRVHNPHVTPEKDRAPATERDGKQMQDAYNKQAVRKHRSYRLIYLTGEEAKAIKEGSLTCEDVRRNNPDRDDDIPKDRNVTMTKPQQEASPEASACRNSGRGPDQTSTGTGEDNKSGRRHNSADTSTGRVHGTRPDVTPARTGKNKEEGRVQEKDQGRSRLERAYESGPDATPERAGEDGETARVHEKAQTSSRQETSPNTSTGQVHGTRPDATTA